MAETVRCNLCVNAIEQQDSGTLVAGEAAVAVDPDGRLQYAYLSQTRSSIVMGRGAISADGMRENHPELMSAFADCEGSEPQVQTIPTRQRSFRRKNEQSTTIICPALAGVIGAINAENVKNYFNPAEEQ